MRHEAAHFLTGYLLGVPVVNYSLMLGKEHTDFAEAKLQAGAAAVGCSGAAWVWRAREVGAGQAAAGGMVARGRLQGRWGGQQVPAWEDGVGRSPAAGLGSGAGPLPHWGATACRALQKRLMEGVLDAEQVDQLSIIAMAGGGFAAADVTVRGERRRPGLLGCQLRCSSGRLQPSNSWCSLAGMAAPLHAPTPFPPCPILSP